MARDPRLKGDAMYRHEYRHEYLNTMASCLRMARDARLRNDRPRWLQWMDRAARARETSLAVRNINLPLRRVHGY